MKLIDRLLHRQTPPTPSESPYIRVVPQTPPQMIASDNQLLIYDNSGQVSAEYTRLSDGNWFCRFPSYDDPGSGAVLSLDDPENIHIDFMYHLARKSQT